MMQSDALPRENSHFTKPKDFYFLPQILGYTYGSRSYNPRKYREYNPNDRRMSWGRRFTRDPVDPETLDPERLDYNNRELEDYADAILRKDAKDGNPIHGDNPILFEEHLYNRRRREILVTSGTPDDIQGLDDERGVHRGDGQKIFNRCNDIDTQALTCKGWKSVDELVLGEDIWAYDLKTDTYSWQPLLDIYRNDDFKGNLDVLESQQISARTTEGHRWVVVHERAKDKRFETTTLKDRYYIPLARPPADKELNESPLHELAGWVLSDGTYGPSNTLVYQALHNPKVAALQTTLATLSLPTEPRFVNRDGVGHWAITNPVRSNLLELMPIKKLSQLDFYSMSYGERASLLKGIQYGDGYTRITKTGTECNEVYTTSVDEADAIQALCTLQGITTSLREIRNSSAFCPIEYAIARKEARGQWAYVRTARRDPEWYEGTVWCPTVPGGFWLARRDGKVFTTGNTHPQGRKVNSAHQRKINGASYYRHHEPFPDEHSLTFTVNHSRKYWDEIEFCF
jgi:hypothetical protein